MYIGINIPIDMIKHFIMLYANNTKNHIFQPLGPNRNIHVFFFFIENIFNNMRNYLTIGN